MKIKPDKRPYIDQKEVREFIIKHVKDNLFRHFSKIYIIGSLSEEKFGVYEKEHEGHLGSDIDLVVIPKQNMKKFKYKGEYHDWHEYKGGIVKFKSIDHPISLLVPIRYDLDAFYKKAKELKWKVIRLK